MNEPRRSRSFVWRREQAARKSDVAGRQTSDDTVRLAPVHRLASRRVCVCVCVCAFDRT